MAALLSGCTASQGGGVPDDGKAVGVVDTTTRPSTTPGLSLRVLPASGTASEVTVEATLNVPADSAPRVMELQLKHSPELEYKGADKGKALEAASKELVVQDKGPELVRALAFAGGNTNSIGSGTLVTFRFAAKGQGPYRLELLTDKPIFAPPQANAGLHVSDPVEVRF
jgi:hypothetical protein